MRRRLQTLELQATQVEPSPLAQRAAALDVLSDAELDWLEDLLTRRTTEPNMDHETWFREHLSIAERQEFERLSAKVAQGGE